MKKNTKKCSARPGWLLLLFAIIISGTNLSHAGPTITSAIHGGASTGIPHGYINCANIDYTQNCNGCSGLDQLNAIASSDGAGTVTIYLDDGVSPINFPISISAYTADLVLGNYIGTTDYYLAVVYATITIPCTGLFDIYMSIYDISGVGSGMTATLTSTPILISDGRGYSNLFPHIDIVADYYNFSTTNIGGYPLCDQFVISYVEPTPNYDLVYAYPYCVPIITSNPNYGVNLYLGSLNGINPTGYQNILTTPYPPNYCDVAAVQRAPIGDVIAYYTYTDTASNWYEGEYDLTAAGIPPAPTYITNGMDLYPRIDAIDDYLYTDAPNSYPTTPTYFDWIAVDNNLSNVVVLQPGYPNVWSLPSSITMGGWSPAVADRYPVITSGNASTGTGLYTTSYFHPNGFNSVLTDPGTAWTAASLSSPSNYYRVNVAPISTPNPLVAISSTCNNDGTLGASYLPEIYECWNNGGYVYAAEKSDVTLWKHGSATGAASPRSAAAEEVTIYPNPAKDHVIITIPGNTVQASYKISDITGKELLRADMHSNTETVDISCFSAGMYLAHIYEAGNEVKTMKFVKE